MSGLKKPNKPLLKWSPAVPIRKPDNLISSHAKSHVSFKPSYENDPKENMNFLMSNEYMRMWFQEKGGYDKDTYTREQIIKDESKIKRRIIQRMMTYRRPPKNHFIDDYVDKKTGQDKLQDQKDQKMRSQKQMKFKPQCPSKSHSGDQIREAKSKSKQKNKTAKASKETDNESDECENKCEIVVQPVKCDCEDK
ncbi:hypothetical protein NQ315_015802 [Exocentrus adspersus]|uniref:Uncharacterized protein n=1 Tax=Exocentrus adspersus TaxID=1586481 RepID=A0AAV8W4I8_9CUCU|nr:hypothetical protein NQ315_015802 [Exocentrus adspersus]